MIFKKKKMIDTKETSLITPIIVKEALGQPSIDLKPPKVEQKTSDPIVQTSFEWTTNLDIINPVEGVDLPDVGDESLEILVDWYEKNFLNPYPSKSHLNKINILTGLSKSTIREWTTIVRKNHLLVVRKEDGSRFLALNPYLNEFKLQRKRSLKDKSKKSPKNNQSQAASSEIKNMSLADTLSEKNSDKERPIENQDHTFKADNNNEDKEESKEE